VDRGLQVFDRIVIGVGRNYSKQGLLSTEQKIRLIEDSFKNEPRVSVELYEELTVDFCRKRDIKFLLRGMRNAQDFEYERNMMQINNMLDSELMTVMLFTRPEYEAVSSSVVRELMAYGKDVAEFLPEGIDINKYRE
jgi:pantetheine-phosphate adenylyltransferase